MTAAPVLILPPDATLAIETQRATVLDEAQALVVADQASLEAGGALLTEVIKPLLKEIEKSCDPVCAAAYAVHQAATKQRADLKAPLLEAEEIVKTKTGDWVIAERRRHAEEERRIHEEQQAAEAKRLRLEKEALDRAARQEAEGNKAQAAQTMTRAIERSERPVTPARVAAPPPQKVKGMSVREEWECDITDKMAFLQAVVDGKIPTTVLKIEIGVMNRLARASDGQVEWPGVTIKKVPQVAGRGR